MKKLLLLLMVLAVMGVTACDTAGEEPTAVPPTATPNMDEPVSSDDPAPTAVPEEPSDQEMVTGEATVETVDVLIMESFPVQVNVRVTGYLGDGCTTLGNIETTRADNTFTVTINTQRPADEICTQQLVGFEETVPLDVMGLAAGTYTVDVNGVTGTFTLDVDNNPVEGEAPAAEASAATQPPTTGDAPYLDDRSGPLVLLQSLVNALNRREYLRAYSYWEENAEGLPTYEEFAQGYVETTAVALETGTVYSGVAAGNTYYDVPVVLRAETTQGSSQTFAGCYRLHLGSPGAQGALPFRPLGIQSAMVTQVTNDAEAAVLLKQQCRDENGNVAGQPLPAATAPAVDDVSADHYIDNRSSGVQVLASYFNAVNRREYVRAYAYWENQAALGTLENFSAGYADTQSVTLTTGTPMSDAGAGQLHTQVPVVLVAQTAAGETQTFSGCYTLHLSNPTIQATPPFRPWGIVAAEVVQVANGIDTQTALAQGCAGN